MTVTFSILLELQVATVGGIGIETLPPVQVILGYVLADGHFFESRYRFAVFDCRLETVGHAAQPQDGSGSYAVQTAGDFTDVGRGRGLWVSQMAEVKQRLCIAIGAAVGTPAIVQVKACRVFAFATLVSGDGFQE